MINFKNLTITELQQLVTYFLANINNIDIIIHDFGKVVDNNGYGTIFLKPQNIFLKVFWIHTREGRLESVGLGGEHLGLKLEDLYLFYRNVKQGFNKNDDEYIYSFYTGENYTHTIKVSSHDKLFDGERVAKNIDVNGIEITLKW